MFEGVLLESSNGYVGSRSVIGADVVDESRIIAIPIFIPEGKAVIAQLFAPSQFIPGVMFGIVVVVRNDGYSDDLFVRITNTDTGMIIAEHSFYLVGGTIENVLSEVTLVQDTDFNGLVEAGHVE